jgi:hypothetical protein
VQALDDRVAHYPASTDHKVDRFAARHGIDLDLGVRFIGVANKMPLIGVVFDKGLKIIGKPCRGIARCQMQHIRDDNPAAVSVSHIWNAHGIGSRMVQATA